MNDNYTYKVVGYTDDYFQRLNGHGNSGYQYSFVARPKFVNRYSSAGQKNII